MKAKSFFINMLVLFGSLLVTFGIVELYVRIFNPQPIRPAFYQTDPIYGLKMVPGLRGYLREVEYTQPFRLNSLGFREKECDEHKPENTYRIMGLGDSFSWGAGVEQSDTFLKRLEEALNRNSDGMYYEVLNWGVNAWGTAQQLLCLKHQVLAYNPDLIILQYFKGNDMNDNVYSGLFRLDKEGKLVRSSYARQKIMRIKKITDHIPFYRFFTQHSHLMNLIRIRLLAKVEKSDAEKIATTFSAEETEYGLQLTEAIVKEFFSVAIKNGIKVVIVVIPDKHEVSLNSVDANSAQQQKFFKEGLMLAGVCRKHNVPLLDLSNIFTQRETSLIYYEIDSHFRSYGHKVVAELIEELLLRHKML